MFSFIWKALAVALPVAAGQRAGPHGAVPGGTWSSWQGMCQSLGRLSIRSWWRWQRSCHPSFSSPSAMPKSQSFEIANGQKNAANRVINNQTKRSNQFEYWELRYWFYRWAFWNTFSAVCCSLLASNEISLNCHVPFSENKSYSVVCKHSQFDVIKSFSGCFASKIRFPL